MSSPGSFRVTACGTTLKGAQTLLRIPKDAKELYGDATIQEEEVCGLFKIPSQ